MNIRPTSFEVPHDYSLIAAGVDDGAGRASAGEATTRLRVEQRHASRRSDAYTAAAGADEHHDEPHREARWDGDGRCSGDEEGLASVTSSKRPVATHTFQRDPVVNGAVRDSVVSELWAGDGVVSELRTGDRLISEFRCRDGAVSQNARADGVVVEVTGVRVLNAFLEFVEAFSGDCRLTAVHPCCPVIRHDSYQPFRSIRVT